MRVIFTTNIDKYQCIVWPEMNGHVPCKGEMVYVTQPFESYCTSVNIPSRLEVCAIRYKSQGYRDTVAYVELWFNDTDLKLYGGGEKLLQ